MLSRGGGISSTFSPSSVVNVTTLCLRGSSPGGPDMVGRSMNGGAFSRREDSGCMFSCSTIVGRDGFAATARAVGETISP